MKRNTCVLCNALKFAIHKKEHYVGDGLKTATTEVRTMLLKRVACIGVLQSEYGEILCYYDCK